MIDIIERAKRYIDTMPPAISGQGGHTATYKAAIAAAQGFALDEEGTLAVLHHYNARCAENDRWSEKELRHKARSACIAPAKRQRGYLLNQAEDGWRPFTMAPSPSTPPAAKQKTQRPFPQLRPGSKTEITVVAELLGISFDAAALAHDNGCLRFGINRNHHAWFVTDRSRLVCQARRMDGERWHHPEKPFKSDTIINSPDDGRHLVGLPLTADYGAVILSEGASDFLAAFDLLLLGDRHEGDCPLIWEVGLLAMFGAKARLLPNEAAHLAGKDVFVCYDNDDTGNREARKRAAELQAAGATPYNLELPPGVNDLRDALRNGHGGYLHQQIAGAMKGGVL